MTDNVTLPGTGATIATDGVSGVQYQCVKLVDGTLDNTTDIPEDATGLRVKGNGFSIPVTLTVTNGA